jgi:hypothetical protein
MYPPKQKYSYDLEAIGIMVNVRIKASIAYLPGGLA